MPSTINVLSDVEINLHLLWLHGRWEGGESAHGQIYGLSIQCCEEGWMGSRVKKKPVNQICGPLLWVMSYDV